MQIPYDIYFVHTSHKKEYLYISAILYLSISHQCQNQNICTPRFNVKCMISVCVHETPIERSMSAPSIATYDPGEHPVQEVAPARTGWGWMNKWVKVFNSHMVPAPAGACQKRTGSRSDMQYQCIIHTWFRAWVWPLGNQCSWYKSGCINCGVPLCNMSVLYEQISPEISSPASNFQALVLGAGIRSPE